ncbi:hypothetical protein ACTID9_01035 [Brevibacillus fluminis]|uniref:hypothetical protein n=1 Tax=Brevibacillus fluminis TaxID=511487 RepID=UPI003F8997EA
MQQALASFLLLNKEESGLLLLRSNFTMTNSQLSFGTGRGIVLIGKSTTATDLARVGSKDDAITDVGEGTNLAKMIEGAMLQRPKMLYTIGLGATPTAGSYKAALIKGAEAPEAYFFVVDDTADATIAEIKDFLAWCDTNAIGAVVLLGGNAALATKAAQYRVWVFDDVFADYAGNAVPAFVTAAATTAAITNEPDLSIPFGGILINGYTLKTVKQIDTLRTQTEAGVMSFVKSGTKIAIFQGATSYVTATNNEIGLKDPAVVVTVDEIIKSVETAITNKHSRIKMSRLQDIADTIYMVLDAKAAEEKIFPPDADQISVEPDAQTLGKANARYHFKVIAGLKELEIGVTGEVAAQNS